MRVQALAYRVLADELEHGDRGASPGVVFETRAA